MVTSRVAMAQAIPATEPQSSESHSSVALQSATPQSAAVIAITGEIDDYNRDMLFRRFKDAQTLGAKVVIVRIDTYGGMVTAGLDISQFIKQQTGMHTIAFIHRKAISAGAMIAMACDEIVMEPNAKIGDCAPIMVRTDGSLQPMPDAERGKIESPILADFRDSAKRNGHDTLLAESMVSVDRVVHFMQSPDGEKRFVNQADYDKLVAADWKPVAGVLDPLDDAKTLLTLHTEQAAIIGLCKEVSVSPEALAASRNYNILQTFAPGAGEKIVQVLNSSWARGLLLTLFLMSAYAAFSIPGHGAPEAVAVVSLGLLVGMPLLAGYAQWWEIVVIFLGLGLLAFEIFVFPGHFVSAIVGAAMVLGGLILTFVPKEPTGLPGFMPGLNGTYLAMERGLIVVASGLGSSLLLGLWLQRYLPSVPYFRKLVLTTSVGDTPGPAMQIVDWPTVGAAGQAVTDLRPGGKAAFLDPALGDARITQVVSDSGFIVSGTKLIVREVAGNRVVVRGVGERGSRIEDRRDESIIQNRESLG